ncbi:MAG: MBL fold metallo-hydrolase [Candidatus Thalassarchaeaceae archaeon]|jgi:pyrroloquinoline quinone biosynthesis protein B|nr:MBL fold metallo-hydrolase [Candidatus Thalassarchaeaceae archaeon]
MRSVRVTVLGSAQDGGFPQPGCQKKCCNVEPSMELQRFPVALGIMGLDGTFHLIEASRMMERQFRILQEILGKYPPVPTSISLTHTHLGHIDGLGLLGKEVMGAEGVIVHCSESVARLIRITPAYQELINQDAIVVQVWNQSESFEPSPNCGFSIRPIPVPHRSELSDNHALIIESPGCNLLFMPDHDSWLDTLKSRTIREWLSELNIDIALIDGTFWDSNELPNRDMKNIPHPTILDSLERLGQRQNSDPEILFFHLNHTNPLCNPNSRESKELQLLGWGIAKEGDSFTLEQL